MCCAGSSIAARMENLKYNNFCFDFLSHIPGIHLTSRSNFQKFLEQEQYDIVIPSGDRFLVQACRQQHSRV
jgi:hypothetical protein